MRTIKIRCVLPPLALSLAILATSGPAAAVPLEVYGRLPGLEDVALSPDGSKIALVNNIDEVRTLAVYSLAEHKQLKRLRFGELKVRGIFWADEDHIVIESSETGMPWGLRGLDTEWSLLQIMDLRNSETVQIPSLQRNHAGINLLNAVAGRVMVRRIAGHTVLFVPAYYVGDTSTMPCLVRYDLETQSQTVPIRGDDNSLAWLVDADGKIVAESDYDQAKGRWRLRVDRKGTLEIVAEGEEDFGAPDLLGFDPTGENALVEMTSKGETDWHTLSLRDGSLGPPMDDGKNFDRPLRDRLTDRMVGAVSWGDESRYGFKDPERQRHWNSVRHAYGRELVTLVSYTSDLKKMVVLVQGEKLGYQYQVVDMSAGRTIPVGDVYKDLDFPLEVRKIGYDAADGLHIPAYLTLPAGRDPHKLPLVVLPHGGPARRDSAHFNYWSQALASQGYAVLQPNFRGSSLSEEFISKGFGEFGRKMQSDLSDGVRYLASEGIIDPTRVCIVGGSYGGYAALAGAALDPGVYRCAASVAGISDLGSFLRWVDRKHWGERNIEQRYWDRFLGVHGRKDPRLDEISPIKHVDAIRVPILLVHGKDDSVVPFEQSDDMADALRDAHKSVEFVKLTDEDHWLSRPATRLQMLRAVVAFLRKNNPPD